MEPNRALLLRRASVKGRERSFFALVLHDDDFLPLLLLLLLLLLFVIRTSQRLIHCLVMEGVREEEGEDPLRAS